MIPRHPVTLAVATLLTTATGLPVGRGQQPLNASPPYYLLYSLDTLTSGAPFADLNEDSTFTYQVTCVSGPDPARPQSAGLADQTEWMADKARTALLARNPTTRAWLHPLTVPGARVIARLPDTETGGMADPADAIMGYALRVKIVLTAA
ncbi:hypothetical protein [Streptomyces sp. NPDC060243]|uniref:hypothetical protein n=1 Tax=Streptomyces sp. NPDC060243 TaxID=3347081 RepID=UPI003667B091